MKIKVLIVDDHLVVLNGLRFFLQTQPMIEIVDQALDGKEALQKVEALKPDVVLMDVIMPGMDGIEATKRIKAQYPDVKVIMLTSFADRESILPALKAGAIGYQLKDVDPGVLVETIIAAMKGQRLLHPHVTDQLVAHVASDADAQRHAGTISILTKREQDVLRQITLGRSNKEIADALRIAEKTVKTHITHILGKLELQDRTQAAMHAVKQRWFE